MRKKDEECRILGNKCVIQAGDYDDNAVPPVFIALLASLVVSKRNMGSKLMHAKQKVPGISIINQLFDLDARKLPSRLLLGARPRLRGALRIWNRLVKELGVVSRLYRVYSVFVAL